ncbi:hypothetical protein Q5P01_007036 [Channa striata]|uniref:Endonuclease/exonuclease/phosphatase domain-containing protein n=1 Tax=Channa striata TaxID=64152 RepID=A0AA88N370_CHASR|nr:hypothetical protein Q5P01_007036 [Channa striata]
MLAVFFSLNPCGVVQPGVKTFAFCFIMLFQLFEFASGDPLNCGSIVYTRDQLLPVLPSVIMGNVRSLSNKMDQLAALIRLQRVYRESSLLCFTETWLNQDTPDSVVSVNGFTLVRADRSAAESGKKKGGGLAVFVNNRWCNPGHITVKQQLCSKDVELVAVCVRPYYLPKEFSHVLAVTVYVPPSADTTAACERVHSTVSQLQTQHPQALILISGDFNHAWVSPG